MPTPQIKLSPFAQNLVPRNATSDQACIKARVSLFRHIKEARNENFDTETIPHPVFA